MSLLEKDYDNSAQEVMRAEYRPPYIGTFKYKIKKAGEEGLLLFAKYALVLFLSYIALQFLTSIISGSQNGTNAVLYLNELQNKGYLPKVVNGQIPNKVENEKTSSSNSITK